MTDEDDNKSAVQRKRPYGALGNHQATAADDEVVVLSGATLDNKIVARCRPVVQRLLRDDLISSEITLRLLLTASNELIPCEQPNKPLRGFYFNPRIDPAILWAAQLKEFHVMLNPGISYVKRLPGFPAVARQDRCHLFCRAVVPLVIAQTALPRNSDYSFFGMSEHNRNVVLSNFPHLKAFSDKVYEANVVFKIWKPTVEELALLNAFLFYQEEARDTLIHPVLVTNIRKRLTITLQEVMSRLNSPDLRLRHFMRIYDLLRVASECFTDAGLSIVNEKTDFTHDQMFIEILGRQNKSSANSSLLLEHYENVWKLFVEKI